VRDNAITKTSEEVCGIAEEAAIAGGWLDRLATEFVYGGMKL
jgi:hypothetical protein